LNGGPASGVAEPARPVSAEVGATASAVTPRRFLGRTLSLARWQEYDRLLHAAKELGWAPLSLESWIAAGGVGGRVLILRHDVDQHPATALRMAQIEAEHGVNATWYFRWRTASPVAIRAIRELGGEVGFHYETLTRLALERRLTAEQIDEELLASARIELAREVGAFEFCFGAIRSICAHGDTRVPGVSNQVLVHGEDPSRFGINFDANEAVSRHRLAVWMTDRSIAEGRWKDGMDPIVVLRESTSPVLCLTHPNNWCSGPSLWSDRLKSWLLPTPQPTKGRWKFALRTGSDRSPHEVPLRPSPPALVARPRLRVAPPVRSFAPIAQSLRREILRHYYDLGEHLVSSQGIRTLETNAGLAESRVASLEHVLRQARVLSVRGLDVIDLGCGFGALSLVLAARGARVTALDPNEVRQRVGARVAEEHGLAIQWRAGRMDDRDLGRKRFDIALMNNSLCYVVDRAARGRALAATLTALRPGGVLVIRNPSRLRLRDQFTGLPFVGMLPPRLADAVGRLLGKNRSHVRLLTTGGALRELRRAGFVSVQSIAPHGRSRLIARFGAYQHLVARRPPS
jgi:2-polyprenyl-3-methyl-5-hydroxy-6-metoxy-1,4-benzoquinol methylase